MSTTRLTWNSSQASTPATTPPVDMWAPATPSARDFYESGWRLRAVGAFGLYHYDGSLPSRGVQVPTNFDGDDLYAAALIGYQFRYQSLFLKVFAGVEAEDQHITPHDPNNSVQGHKLGLQIAGRELV